MKKVVFNMSKATYYIGAFIAFMITFLASIIEDSKIISGFITSIFIAIMWPAFVVFLIFFIFYMQIFDRGGVEGV